MSSHGDSGNYEVDYVFITTTIANPMIAINETKASPTTAKGVGSNLLIASISSVI